MTRFVLESENPYANLNSSKKIKERYDDKQKIKRLERRVEIDTIIIAELRQQINCLFKEINNENNTNRYYRYHKRQMHINRKGSKS